MYGGEMVESTRSTGANGDAARAVEPPRLGRLLQLTLDVHVDSGSGDGRAEWLRAGDWRLLAGARGESERAGDVIEQFTLESGKSVTAVRHEDGSVYVPFDLEEAYANYVLERWVSATAVRALSERQLRLYYRVKRLVPRRFLLAARRAFIRRGSPPEFPAWPFEHGVDRLLRFTARCLLEAADVDEAAFPWFWPHGHHAAVILTHDVESAAGLRGAVDIANLEESRGLRSSFNIVGDEYDIDPGVIRELTERGFEIGLHGLHHDRSLFSSREEFERQAPALDEAARRLGASGFRSPATYRVQSWIGELPVAYDASVPHSDPYEPQPGGCCTLWPYMLGDVVELPYTLPQDHTLFNLLQHDTADVWLRQVAIIEEHAGLIQCLSHPDPGYLGRPKTRAIYAAFLDALVARETLWKALPRDVADWWRRRERGETSGDEHRPGRIRRADGREYARFEPPELDRPPAARP